MSRESDPALMQLVERAQGGDDEALDRVFRAVLPELEAYVRLQSLGRAGPRESMADVVQSVCREVVEDLHGFRGSAENQFRKWLFTVAFNKLASRGRFHRAARRDAGREAALGSSSSPGIDAAQLQRQYGSVCSPSRVASAREEVERFEAAFEQLPDDYRRVIALSCIAGLPHCEVAEAMGRAETAVRKLLSRARARLSLLLAQGASGGPG